MTGTGVDTLKTSCVSEHSIFEKPQEISPQRQPLHLHHYSCYYLASVSCSGLRALALGCPWFSSHKYCIKGQSNDPYRPPVSRDQNFDPRASCYTSHLGMQGLSEKSR